jgi:hypothetical protein
MDGIKRLIFAVIIVAVLSLMPSLTDTMPPQPSSDSTDEAVRADVLEAYGKLPVLFIQNDGQLDDRVEYYSEAAGQTLYLTDDGIVIDLVRYYEGREEDAADRKAERLVFSIDFLGANERPLIEAGDKDKSTVNYLIGNNPDEWHTGIPTYRQLVYEEIYPSIDLRLYGKGGVLEYEFVVKPGASVADIALECTGVDKLAIEEGKLVASTAFGDIEQTQPYIYQEIGDDTVEIDGGFRLVSGSAYGFETAVYDAGYPLIIDPSLVYSTYLGGGGDDFAWSIAIDSSGCAYVTGWTDSADFPTSNPYQGANAGDYDAFVTKLSASGNTAVYSTYLGGGGDDAGRGIAVDSSCCAYVGGYTLSADFPTSNPYQGANAGDYDVFVTKLSASGSTIAYSTYLGGGGTDYGRGIAIDGSGCAYVTGATYSADFPTSNPYQGDAGGTDAFVTKLSASGNTTVYSTYLGGGAIDWGRGIAVDGSGCAYAAGYTDSADFPTNNPYQGNQGGRDAFVTKFSASGNTTVYSTYLGGSAADEMWGGIAVDGSGCAYVNGPTESADFPTNNPYQGANAGADDVFVTKLSASGNTTVYSTYLGGGSLDWAWGMAVDGSGCGYVIGYTDSADFPISNPYQGVFQGGTYDVFVTKLSAAGNTIDYSTYLGGGGDDKGYGIAVDGSGCAYVAGRTTSADFPTSNPYQGAFQGGVADAFITKLSGIPPVPPNLSLGGYYIQSNILGTRRGFPIGHDGRVQQKIEVTSADGLLTINIPQGTVARDNKGNRLRTLDVSLIEEPLPSPPGANIIGLPYDFEPDGATFDPPITLTFKYDPADIPEGVAETDLVLAYYDEEAETWVTLECEVDTETHTVIALVSHFTDFALLGKVEILPAAFSLSSLTIRPAEVKPEETVTITVSVSNTGGTEGSYTVSLEIDGTKETEKSVTVESGGSELVSFSVSRQEAGSYTVTVNGIEGVFTVQAPEPVSPPAPPEAPVESTPAVEEGGVNWYIIGTILGIVILLAISIPIWVRRRRYG